MKPNKPIAWRRRQSITDEFNAWLNASAQTPRFLSNEATPIALDASGRESLQRQGYVLAALVPTSSAPGQHAPESAGACAGPQGTGE